MSSSRSPLTQNRGVVNRRPQIEHIMWGHRAAWSPLWWWPCIIYNEESSAVILSIECVWSILQFDAIDPLNHANHSVIFQLNPALIVFAVQTPNFSFFCFVFQFRGAVLFMIAFLGIMLFDHDLDRRVLSGNGILHVLSSNRYKLTTLNGKLHYRRYSRNWLANFEECPRKDFVEYKWQIFASDHTCMCLQIAQWNKGCVIQFKF